VEKKKKSGQGGWDFRSSGKRPQRAHPQLVHWWLLIHSSPRVVQVGWKFKYQLGNLGTEFKLISSLGF
jgi:hypothetical protein